MIESPSTCCEDLLKSFIGNPSWIQKCLHFTISCHDIVVRSGEPVACCTEKNNLLRWSFEETGVLSLVREENRRCGSVSAVMGLQEVL